MIRIRFGVVYLPVGWPRTSGDDPCCQALVLVVASLAPHERG